MTRTGWQVSWLITGLLLLGCSDGQEPLASTQSSIVNGTPVDDNINDVVRLNLEFPSGDPAFGSGVIWENSGSMATVLTAAHVLTGGLSGVQRPTTIEVTRQDGGSDVESQFGTINVLHPATLERFAMGGNLPGEQIMVSDWVDVGIVLTAPFETARNLVEPLAIDPVFHTGSTVEQFGYGPTVEEDNSTSGDLHRFSGVMNGFPLRSRGVPTLSQGTAVQVVDPTGDSFSQKGDSGGPVLLEGTRTLVSLHLGRPKGISTGTGIPSLTDWIEAVRLSRGILVSGQFARGVKRSQLIVLPGSNWIIHVEKSDGTRVVHDVVAGPGLGGLQATTAISKGFFNAGALEDGLVGLLATGGQQLVEVLNPGDPSVAPVPRLLSSTVYSSFSVKRVNGDAFSDVVAERAAGGQHIFYGSADGLKGPFGPNTFRSCLNAGSHRKNACGSNSADGSCSCSAACAGGGGSNCCSDAQTVCGGIAQDELTADADALASLPSTAPTASTGDQPIVRLASSAGEAAGLLLNRSWVLAPADVATGSDLELSQQTDTGQQALAVQAVVEHPDAPVALVRLTGDSPVVLPADFQVPFFSGGPGKLGEEAELHVFGRNAADAQFSDATFPGTAVHSPNSDEVGVEFGFELIETQDLLSPALAFPKGSPVLVKGALVSMTLGSTVETINQPDGNVDVTLHQQLPFVALNTVPDDDRPSPRYFVQQTLTRDGLRDFDVDGLQDLWVFQQPTSEFFPSLLALPFTDATVAGEGVAFGPAQGDDGNWRYVGRAKVGTSTTAVVWQEIDRGDIQVWKLNEALDLVDSINFNVAPPWQLRALDDIDGDGIADWLWTNSTFNTSFFWLMRDVDKFAFSELSANPADMITYGQWFNGMPLNEVVDSATFELVGADHFVTPKTGVSNDPPTGPEQTSSDLVWQRVSAEGTSAEIWSMTLVHRTCDEIVDPLILADCLARGTSVLTYELTRNLGSYARPAHFRVAGSADFNTDGRADLVWHARDGAPAAEAGHVQLWLSNAQEEFDQVTVTRDGEPMVIDSSEGLEVSVR